MIVRIWHGETLAEKADTYYAYLQATGLKDLQATEGNRGVLLLRREHDGRAEFLLLSFWDSFDAIRRFSGEDVARAVYYPEDEAFLLAFDPEVRHYDLLHPAGESKSMLAGT